MKLALVAVLLLVQDDLQKEMMKGWKHPWEGATIGTWIKRRNTTYKEVKNTSGDSSWEEKKSDATWTVTKVEGQSLTLTRQVGKRKVDSPYYLGPSSGYVGTAAKAGEEEIKVGQKSFKCTIYEIKKDIGKGRVQLTRVWKCPDAPVWAVKDSFLDSGGGGKDIGHVEELIGIDEVVKIGDKEYKCQVLRRTNEAMGMKLVETTWWCDDLPGRAAKKLSQRFQNDKEEKRFSSQEELVEFEKK